MPRGRKSLRVFVCLTQEQKEEIMGTKEYEERWILSRTQYQTLIGLARGRRNVIDTIAKERGYMNVDKQNQRRSAHSAVSSN